MASSRFRQTESDLLFNDSIPQDHNQKFVMDNSSEVLDNTDLSSNQSSLQAFFNQIGQNSEVHLWIVVSLLVILVLIVLIVLVCVIKKILNSCAIRTPIDDLKLSLLGSTFIHNKKKKEEEDKKDDDSISSKSIETEEDAKSKIYLGELELSLDYDFAKQELSVSVAQCKNLPPMDMTGKSDPYVKCYILPEKKKKFETKVHRKTLNPIFNETFIFKNVEYNFFNDKTLVLAIFDFDRFSKHDQIGEVRIPLGTVDFGKVFTEWREITAPVSQHSKTVGLGEICFSIRYVPNTGKLTVCILEAKNLKQMDIGGLSDPFVKIYLMNGKKRIAKKKTTVQKSTLSPYFNEAFTFELHSSLIQSCHLIIAVYDYDLIGSSDLIGKCTVGNGQEGAGQQQWYNMLAAPRRPIANWHTLHYPDDPKNSLPKLVEATKS